jgi:hypothetical protein
LTKGINLTEYTNTPQQKQAAGVRTKLKELWDMEGDLRGMKFIEYMDDYKVCPNKTDLGSVEKYLDSAFNRYPDPYYKDQLKKYISNKPKEEEMLKKSDQIRKEVYILSVPEQHVFKIISK